MRSPRTIRLALLFYGLACLTAASIPQTATSQQTGSLLPMAYHYEAVPGKFLGLWPDTWTVERLVELKRTYGFSAVFIVPDMQQYLAARQAGFAPDSIMVSLETEDYLHAIDSLPAGFYYVDEPVEHDCSGNPAADRGTFYPPETLQARKDSVHSRRPGSLFVVSGYKRCSHNDLVASSDYSDRIMYSSYHAWNNASPLNCIVNMGFGEGIEPAWLKGNIDQRDSWSDMRGRYKEHFDMTWVMGGDDDPGSEYDQLLAHATNLDISAVWMFNGPAIDPGKLEQLCDAAMRNGWLFKVGGPPAPALVTGLKISLITGSAALLEWNTSWEVGTEGFSVDRLRNPEVEYRELGGSFLPGADTSYETRAYSYTDTTLTPGQWSYRVRVEDKEGNSFFSDVVTADILTDVTDGTVPATFALKQNYPNPFNSSTVLRYECKVKTRVRLSVLDLLGREVALLVDEEVSSGSHSIHFDASGLAGGVYLCRLGTSEGIIVRKMTLLK